MFGYEPNFECLPDPDIDMILNAVKTGVELYEKESTDTSVLLQLKLMSSAYEFCFVAVLRGSEPVAQITSSAGRGIK